MPKKPIPRKNLAGHRKTPLIKVINEKGRTVYLGKDRRKHTEQVLFDSRAADERRFVPGPEGISHKRRMQLSKRGKGKIILEKKTYVSERNPKHREKKI